MTDILDRLQPDSPLYEATRDAAREEIVRLRLQSKPDWQPISTAPKDGTPIITYRIGEPDSYEINEWYQHKYTRYQERVDGLYEKVTEDGACGWTQNAHRATHWMPLPPPPKEKE